MNKKAVPGSTVPESTVNKYTYVRRRAERLFSKYVGKDWGLIDAVQTKYLAGSTKQQLIEEFFPDQADKSSHVNEIFINKILEGIDSAERKKRYQQTQSHLKTSDSHLQSERGKRGGLKKKLSSEIAKMMNQQPPTTPEQRECIMKRKSSLSGTKNQILQQISELFLEEF
ncbi:MAG: hypothetical protein LBH96_05360 [Candidatus Peribacteria bacterium]|jgi:hypothetical protein|nr:hypothetical protein [Candidatus Peribacteria bacterium]